MVEDEEFGRCDASAFVYMSLKYDVTSLCLSHALARFKEVVLYCPSFDPGKTSTRAPLFF